MAGYKNDVNQYIEYKTLFEKKICDKNNKYIFWGDGMSFFWDDRKNIPPHFF